MTDNGSSVGIVLIAGILIVVVVGLGLFATGNLDMGGKDVDVNVELPIAPAVPGG